MTLSLGLDVARSSLSTTAEQTSVVSRNVANAGNPNATRKHANVVTRPVGGVRVASITRVADAALLEKMLQATSASAAQRAMVERLDALDRTVNDPELDASPAALIGRLNDALQQYATGPQDGIRARTAVAAAVDLANALNSATQAVQLVRAEADAGIAEGVERLNTLLARFEAVNAEIVKGSRAGRDITDQLDTRDGLLASISEEIGIRTIVRDDNDMVIFTDGGVTLFDTRPRSVTFQRTHAYAAGTVGNPVYVDGVPVTASGGLASSSGRIAGLIAMRDGVAVTYQAQLDEMARGLIEVFAESDQSAIPALPDAPGLFTYPGAPAMPASGTLLTGLAGVIRVAASVDPDQGGNPFLLRDGGIAGNPAYVYNTGGEAGYFARIQDLIEKMATPRAFDPAADLATTASIAGFSASSVGWLQDARSTAHDDAAYKEILLQRASEALTKVTGVNLDEEMALLLELERSYQASTRLIATIDNMLASLLSATG